MMAVGNGYLHAEVRGLLLRMRLCEERRFLLLKEPWWCWSSAGKSDLPPGTRKVLLVATCKLHVEFVL